MNARTPFDQTVTEWLIADAPAPAPSHVLPTALARVADARQDRYLSQRLLGDRLGRSPGVRWALVVALIGLALVGAALAAGALLPKIPPINGGPPSNGLIAFAANGQAGPRLEGTIVEPRAGDKDIYVVGSDGISRRVIGTQDDGINQTCPMFSSDGSRLVYREVDLRTVTPTPAPVPSGASESPLASDASAVPQPQTAGGPRWTFVVTSIGSDGSPTGDSIRITPQADQNDQIISCPLWSPDGTRLAYTADPGKALWIVTLDRRSTRIPPPPAPFNTNPAIAWSPDGKTVAYAYVDRVWLFPVDGGTATTVPTGEVESVSWSPDGTRLIAFRDGALHVFARNGTELLSIPAQSAGFWSPDGRWIAHVAGGRIQLVSSDGQTTRPLDVDAEALVGRQLEGIGVSIVSWSPDSKRLLLGIGQPLGATALVSVPLDEHEPTIVLVPWTGAVNGGGVTWQPINP